MSQNAQKSSATVAKRSVDPRKPNEARSSLSASKPRKSRKPRKKRLLPNAVTKAVGQQLRRFREAVEMTQEDLAEKAEVEHSRVSKVENGIVNASTLSLAAFCHALGITLSELFAEVKLAHPPSIEGGTLRRTNQAVLDKPAVKRSAKILTESTTKNATKKSTNSTAKTATKRNAKVVKAVKTLKLTASQRRS